MSRLLQPEVLSRLPESLEFVNMVGPHLTVKFIENLSVGDAGSVLLNLERKLHREVDREIQVFLEAKVDANKLRTKLRGVRMG